MLEFVAVPYAVSREAFSYLFSLPPSRFPEASVCPVSVGPLLWYINILLHLLKTHFFSSMLCPTSVTDLFLFENILFNHFKLHVFLGTWVPGPRGSEASDTPEGRIILSLCEPLGCWELHLCLCLGEQCGSLKNEPSLQALQSYFALHWERVIFLVNWWNLGRGTERIFLISLAFGPVWGTFSW